MSSAVSTPQSKLLQRLLKTGRWNNKSEVVRYGIELVAREIERESLSPISDAAVADAYEKMSPEEIEADARLGRASLKAQKAKA